jgi:hypothetical protein
MIYGIPTLELEYYTTSQVHLEYYYTRINERLSFLKNLNCALQPGNRIVRTINHKPNVVSACKH